MTGRVWLIVADDTAIGGLVNAGRVLGGELAAVVVGDRRLADVVAGAVDRVDWLACRSDTPAEAYASAAAAHLAGAGATVVLAGTGPASRVVLGAVAAGLGAPVLANVRDVAATGDGVRVTRLVYGGIAVEHDRVAGPVGLLLDPGRRVDPDPPRTPAPVRTVGGLALPVTCTDPGSLAAEEHDLAAATRVIGVGRGLRGKEDLGLVGALARALGAEVACSRPVAEDRGWLPRDRYLGVSGRRIAPRLYLALGISGQLQHMIGVRDATTIVAVNTDPAAPVIEQSDFSVVGDLYAVVPALIDQLTRP